MPSLDDTSRTINRNLRRLFFVGLLLVTNCSKPSSSGHFRVAFPSTEPSKSYDPAAIRFAHHYIFLANIYSTLVEFSPDEDLVSGLAERFEWHGTTARFTLRQGATTASGKRIDAYDAEVSLKRLLILGKNTHGDLRHLLCPKGIRSLSEPCPGIKVLDDGLTLTLHFPKRLPFLFPMLSHIDFAVIPRSSIDLATLAITDMRDTSGPYYIAAESAGGNITLHANPNHFHFNDRMPRTIQMVPASAKAGQTAIDLLERGAADLAPAVGRESYKDKSAFARTHPEVGLHETAPIQLAVMAFTQRGIRRLPKHLRVKISGRMKAAFLRNHPPSSGFLETSQIFPPLGEGAIPQETADSLASRLNEDAAAIELSLNCWDLIPGGTAPGSDAELARVLPRLKTEVVKNLPGLVDYHAENLEEPDFYMMLTDVSGVEDVGLLSFYSKLDFFHLRGDAAKDWLSRYIETPDKEDRLARLRTLHHKTLEGAYATPFAVQPYASLLRNRWNYSMPKVRVEEAFWRIESR